MKEKRQKESRKENRGGNEWEINEEKRQKESRKENRGEWMRNKSKETERK